MPVAALGFLLGGIDVAAVALAVRTGGEGRAGIPSAAASVGSLLGGLAYGRWRVPGAVRMIVQVRVLVTAAAGLVVLAAVASRWLPVLAAVLMLVGACTGPAIVASYLVADAVLPVGTRATAWVTAAFNVFLAAGTAVAGRLVDVAGPAGGLAAPALFAAVMLLAASLPRPLIARALPYGSRLRSASSDPPERPPSVDAAPTAG